ncbi:MAG: hypothetical protein U0905_14395 [Pirellulales bacterium]
MQRKMLWSLLAFLVLWPHVLYGQASPQPNAEEANRQKLATTLVDLLEQASDPQVIESTLIVMSEWKVTSERIDRIVMQGLRSEVRDEQMMAVRLLVGDCVTWNFKMKFDQGIQLLERVAKQVKEHPDDTSLKSHYTSIFNQVVRILQADRLTSVEVLREQLSQAKDLGVTLQMIRSLGANAYELRSDLIDILSHSSEKSTQLACLDILRQLRPQTRTTRQTTATYFQTLFNSFDSDRDGGVSLQEFQARPDPSATFNITAKWDHKLIDRNNDGKLDQAEWLNHFGPAIIQNQNVQALPAAALNLQNFRNAVEIQGAAIVAPEPAPAPPR